MTIDCNKSRKVVWLASYPKCGATWTQSIVGRAGIQYGVTQGDLDVYKLIASGGNPAKSNAIKPEITSDMCAILKTHRPWRGEGVLHRELPLDMAAFVHIIRNPLDMLLSYINFTRMQYKSNRDNLDFKEKLFVEFLGFDKPFTYDAWLGMKLEDIPQKNLDIALQNFTKNKLHIPSLKFVGGNWFEFNLSWNEAAAKYPSVRIRYEDCIQNPSSYSTLTKIFKFSNEDILQAVNDIQMARKKETTNINTKVFYNKMSSYYYLDFFSPALIRDFIEVYYTELELFGYEDLPVTK